MEEARAGFDDFSAELQDFKVKKVGKFERLWNVGFGGSVDQKPLVHEGVLYFGCCDRNLYALDAQTGKLMWKFTAEGLILESSPVLWNDMILIGSFDQNMYAIDIRTGKPVWKFRTRGEICSCAAVSGGIAYFGCRDQNVYAVRADDGTLVWKFKTFDAIISTPTIHDGKVFVGSFDRNMYCLDAGTGKLIWRFGTQGEIYNVEPLTVHEGIVYFGSFDNYLRAVRIADGHLLWRFRTGMYGMAAGPVLHGSVLYQETRDGVLYALTMDGKVVWKFVTRELVALPVIHDGRIYIGSADQLMYCLDAHNGKVVWKFSTQGAVWWAPAVWKNLLFFSSWDCHMYAVDKDTGNEVWRFGTGSPPSYLPPFSEGFEVEFSISGTEFKEESREKKYDLGFTEEEETRDFYKSRITYQVSTQYQEKGKYQVDSEEESF